MPRKFVCNALTILCLLTLFAVNGGVVAQPPTDEELIRRVDELVTAALKQPGAVGFSVAAARGDTIVLAKGYGLAEVEHDVAASADTMFRIGSITKQYTAAAIMRLYEQGKLGLDDDMHKFLPDFPTQDHTVTIRHLLTHTSGIHSYTSDGEFMQNRTGLELTHEQLLAEFKDDPFDFAPGEKWAYNNSGYYLLGMIIEKISGKPYGQYVQDEFFTPLKLTRTRYDSTSEVIKNRAQGYRTEGDKLLNDQSMAMSIPGGAGGLIASAQNMVRWQMALTTGHVVSQDSFKQMCTPVTLSDGKTRDYGFGLAMKAYRDQPWIGHGGGIFGFNSMMVYFPDHHLHIAVISNGQNAPSAALLNTIADVALGLPKDEIRDLVLTAEQMRRYLGTYKLADVPLEAKVFIRDGKLFAQATNQPEFRLMPQGNHEFRADFDNAVKLVFGAEGDEASSFILHQGGGKVTASRIPEGP
jgi:D-alanyl-D-alanine carboxypeptidase